MQRCGESAYLVPEMKQFPDFKWGEICRSLRTVVSLYLALGMICFKVIWSNETPALLGRFVGHDVLHLSTLFSPKCMWIFSRLVIFVPEDVRDIQAEIGKRRQEQCFATTETERVSVKHFAVQTRGTLHPYHHHSGDLGVLHNSLSDWIIQLFLTSLNYSSALLAVVALSFLTPSGSTYIFLKWGATQDTTFSSSINRNFSPGNKNTRAFYADVFLLAFSEHSPASSTCIPFPAAPKHLYTQS